MKQAGKVPNILQMIFNVKLPKSKATENHNDRPNTKRISNLKNYIHLGRKKLYLDPEVKPNYRQNVSETKNERR